ncbi:phosphatidylinositol 3-kinase, putative, partial [Entamoeba invadens IP1]
MANIPITIPEFMKHTPRSTQAVEKFFKNMKPIVAKTYEEYTIGKPSVPLNLPFSVKIHLPKELQKGVKSIELEVEKSMTVDDLLKKFFDRFGVGIIQFRNVLLDDCLAGLVLLCCLNDGDDLTEQIFQFILIHNIEADFFSSYVSMHGVKSKLLNGLLEMWMFEKEKTFLDTFFAPVKMRVHNGLFEIDPR